jgi:NAD-dependent dihydropyrimidine dehydrogenase PreA subunit
MNGEEYYKAKRVPNMVVAGRMVVIDFEKCTGCKACCEVCRSDVMVPNPEDGKPPIVLYPDECWLCGCCVEHCPRDAIRIEFPLSQRIGWIRKETGKYGRVGLKKIINLVDSSNKGETEER